MMNLWPTDIFQGSVLKPYDILKLAADQLRDSAKQALQAYIIVDALEDRVSNKFMIKSQYRSLEVKLFEAVHRSHDPYPAALLPPAPDIPEFLRRERLIPGSRGTISAFMPMYLHAEAPDEIVTNEWVCATPSEFTDKLKKLLALDHVKSKIVSLMAIGSHEPHSEPQSRSEQQRPEGES